MWLSPQLAVVTVSSSWGVWHRFAWQVTVRAQASFLPYWGSMSLMSRLRRKGAGWLLQGEGRQEGAVVTHCPLLSWE